MKAQGDGWLMTVTLIEGVDLSPNDNKLANPYVVFTCSGKRRTSSVKLRTLKPRWRGTFLVSFFSFQCFSCTWAGHLFIHRYRTMNFDTNHVICNNFRDF